MQQYKSAPLKQFRQLQQRLEEAGIRLEASADVLNYLGEAGFDPQFGTRPRVAADSEGTYLAKRLGFNLRLT